MDCYNEELVHLLVDSIKEFKNLNINNQKNMKHSEATLLIKLSKYLKDKGEIKIKTTDLSKILKLSPSTISPIINSLEEKGYLRKNV